MQSPSEGETHVRAEPLHLDMRLLWELVLLDLCWEFIQVTN
jgi:hypothetical protein